MSVVHLIGTPKLTIEFFDLSSWNSIAYAHHKATGPLLGKMRDYGRKMAEHAIEVQYPNLEFGEYIVKRALVVVRVQPPKEEISDIHNVCLKGVFDGFTLAGVWEDDEWATLPLVLIVWDGIDKVPMWREPKRATKTKRGKYLRGPDGEFLTGPDGKRLREPSRQIKTKRARMRRTIIEVHELGGFKVDNIWKELPVGGRTRTVAGR